MDKDEQLEKLEFQNYVLKIEHKNISSGEVVDKNTYNL